MIGYCVTPTGYFTGNTVEATPSPFRAGEYLLPAFSVWAPPPQAPEGHIQRWIGSEWVVEVVPPELTIDPPVAVVEDPWSLLRQKAAFFLTRADEYLDEVEKSGLVIPREWTEYRAALAELVVEKSGDVTSELPMKPDPILLVEEHPKLEKTFEEQKEAALWQIFALLDQAAVELTGNAPMAERLSWVVKQGAARAFKARSATPDEEAMLAAEASLTDETIDELAGKILETAAAYWVKAGLIAGLRRAGSAKVAAADSPEEVRAALDGVEAEIRKVLK